MKDEEGRRRGLYYWVTKLRPWVTKLRSWVGRLSWIQKMVAALLSVLGAIVLILGMINGFYDLCAKVGICPFQRSITFSPRYSEDFDNAPHQRLAH